MSAETDVLVTLYDALDINPDDINIHERILEAWIDRQDDDMALEIASELVQLDPNNELALKHLKSREVVIEGAPRRSTQGRDRSLSPLHASSMSADQWQQIETEVEDGYATLNSKARMLIVELRAVSNNSDEEVQMLRNLNCITEGRLSAVAPMELLPVRETARNVTANQTQAKDILVEDFETVIQWMKLLNPQPDADTIRARLIKRKDLMEAALPESLSAAVSAAFARVERELLEKRYVNDSTIILGEPISSIPRDLFFVTEDNYAWDMEELAQSISSNGGVMRNPLSRELFSESDIQSILSHPVGKRLRLMQEAQHQLKKGFRVATLDWIEKLGTIMLQDQTQDSGPSRGAVDEFLAYVAILPESERHAIYTLKVPANDRHTGQAYDYTVGDSVRDAKANTTCFHKVGDFLSQAGPYLRRQ